MKTYSDLSVGDLIYSPKLDGYYIVIKKGWLITEIINIGRFSILYINAVMYEQYFVRSTNGVKYDKQRSNANP